MTLLGYIGFLGVALATTLGLFIALTKIKLI